MSPARREWFDRLAREHAEAVYRTARRVVARDDLAEEVTQEVFLRVLKHPETYLDREDGEPLRALRWLAVKKSLERIRADRNRSRREDVAMEGTSETSGRSDEPSEVGATREAHAALGRALARLPEELRVAVALRFQENWTFAEIATATAVSEPSAHDRVRRGLEKLRGWLTTAGFGAMALSVERLLESAPAPAAPAELASRIAALGAEAGASAGLAASGFGAKSATTLVAGALGVGLVTVAAALGLGIASEGSETPMTIATVASDPPSAASPASDPTDSSRAPAIVATVTDGTRRETAIGAPPPPTTTTRDGDDRFAAMDHATITGRVTLHRDDASLLPSVSVIATSLRHASKGDRTRWTTAVNADGTYSLTVPVETDGAFFSTWIEYAGARLARNDDRKVTPNATIADHDFTFAKRIGERDGEFRLIAMVTDENGAPRSGATIVLYRSIEYLGAEPYEVHEAGGIADANGRVTLRGTKLGRKRLSLGHWMGDALSASTKFEIDRAGDQERTFVLTTPAPIEPEANPLWTVTGRVVDLTSGQPLLDEFHVVDLIAPPPDLPSSSLREDWLPNAAWLPDSRQVAVGFDAKESDRFEAAASAPGEYFLVAWRGPYAPHVSGPFDLRSTRSITDATIGFEKAATIRGRVVDDRGAPLARAHLVITGVGPFSDARVAAIAERVTKQSGDGYVHGSAARTGPDGRFEFTSAPLDTPFRIVALHPDRGRAATSLFTLREGAVVDPLEIEISP